MVAPHERDLCMVCTERMELLRQICKNLIDILALLRCRSAHKRYVGNKRPVVEGNVLLLELCSDSGLQPPKPRLLRHSSPYHRRSPVREGPKVSKSL